MEENKRINLTVKHLLQRVSKKIKDVLAEGSKEVEGGY